MPWLPKHQINHQGTRRGHGSKIRLNQIFCLPINMSGSTFQTWQGKRSNEKSRGYKENHEFARPRYSGIHTTLLNPWWTLNNVNCLSGIRLLCAMLVISLLGDSVVAMSTEWVGDWKGQVTKATHHVSWMSDTRTRIFARLCVCVLLWCTQTSVPKLHVLGLQVRPLVFLSPAFISVFCLFPWALSSSQSSVVRSVFCHCFLVSFFKPNLSSYLHPLFPDYVFLSASFSLIHVFCLYTCPHPPPPPPHFFLTMPSVCTPPPPPFISMSSVFISAPPPPPPTFYPSPLFLYLPLFNPYPVSLYVFFFLSMSYTLISAPF